MSETTANQNETATPDVGLESGTYEIIRSRLLNSGQELRRRLDQLNEARRQVFGSIETALLSTERISTAHNCVARDMVAVGDQFLFGYNVHLGLKSEMDISDVFSIYSFRDHTLRSEELTLLNNDEFHRDFKDLFRYYKNAEFARFAERGPHLFMVFRVGRSESETKVFKWLLSEVDQVTTLTYVDNRSDHEFRYPPQHDFEWIRTTRDDHHYGDHPHVSIKDRVFVETVGGDLTIKVENNTETGEGIYAEPVDDHDQTLDDGEIHYAIVGNVILLKIRPYQEREYRYIVYNEKLQQAMRLDSIRDACVLLPDDHGLIFSNGYYLQDGEYKTFDHDLQDMMFERTIVASSGEDYLYVFHNRTSGAYVLLQYNLIEQRVQTPLICNGSAFFQAGEMLCFRGSADPQKHHAIQVWQTPFVDDDYVPPTENDSFLSKIGNRDIVRGMAECHEVLKLINKEDSYANLYSDLARQSGDLIDSYFWLNREDTFNLAGTLADVQTAAKSAVDEFDRVVRVRKNTEDETRSTEKTTQEILGKIRNRRFEHIDDFVASLSDLRGIRGRIISLRELRYVDEGLVAQLEEDVADNTERLSQKCVEFLLKPESLQPYDEKIQTQRAAVDGLTGVVDAKALEEEVATGANELEMLIDIVSNLKIDDATQRTAIIDSISEIFSDINSTRAVLKKKRVELASVEGVAEFNSQIKLLNQSVVNYLDICDTPEKCDEFLTKLMIQLEELEGRFSEFDDFILQLTEKREEVVNAFDGRKLQLVEARNKRANALMDAAERVLKGIQSRVQSLETVEEINGYFASDLMIEKVRDLIDQLGELDDTVKVDDLQSRLRTVQQDAVRQLKDRQELFVDGENAVKFGKHVFSVNTQPLDLTTVARDGELHLHLTGTNFFEAIDLWSDGQLDISDAVLSQEVVSENREVYRAEYLAWKLLETARHDATPLGLPQWKNASALPAETKRSGSGSAEAFHHRGKLGRGAALSVLATLSDDELLSVVQRFMGPRYSEGYTKGVHDVDATKIVHAIVGMESEIGLLRYSSNARALALLWWKVFVDRKMKSSIAARMKAAGAIGAAFGNDVGRRDYVAELQRHLTEFQRGHDSLNDGEANAVQEAAEYLFDELSGKAKFSISRNADELSKALLERVENSDAADAFAKSNTIAEKDPVTGFALLRNWVRGFVTAERSGTRQEFRQADAATEASENSDDHRYNHDYIDEVAVSLMPQWGGRKQVIKADVEATTEGMVGSHANIDGGSYHLNYNHFTQRLTQFDSVDVPRFNDFAKTKHEVVEEAREEMRLEEFRPRVLTSFVRNRLLNDVYLPLIGDNLAKQIGATGDGKRTDLMGLLLLVSPPGYGKTTLMEYIANRLGLIFMKINGPALGHGVTSLDPAEATNAGAREELEKLNLAFEMGDNVMIYLDDIQHTNPEFLQKFISLCDAQRKIEGVYKGRPRTYDLRGRKVAVVMAGNPYTESGEKFQIPDMLSNRADIYNLGEIIGESADAFEMSYLENALTSNPALARLANRSQQDVYAIIRMAEDEPRDSVELEGNYSVEELNELVGTMRKLIRVRDVILTVNREYIRSAAQSDDYRTEPAFKLQGSYRNMNRIAEKVVPIMNEDELTSLIVSSYENDAQTLTSGAEANLLKFRELIDLLTDEQQQRWENIKRTFRQNVKMRGIGSDDKAGQVIATLANLNDGLESIRAAVEAGVGQMALPVETADDDVPPLTELAEMFDGGLNELHSELAAIRETLANGVEKLKEPREVIATSTAAVETPSPARPRDDRSELELQSDGNRHRLTVVNRVPRTVVGILKQHFKLMNSWLQPMHKATMAQRKDNQRLLKHLEECAELYRTLIERIESSK